MAVFSGPRKHQCAKKTCLHVSVKDHSNKQHSMSEIPTDTRGAKLELKG